MLESIQNINDIKKLSEEERNILAKDIRQEILDTVLLTGGHLASNLGIVELTIALATVFNFEKDKIIFDVGHQCYPYKLLTNRLNLFKNIRHIGGASGFPKLKESKYDHFNSGHASNSIAIASGYSFAMNKLEDDSEIITMIGDGALTGGLAYESLNNLSNSKKRQIIILNDNSMSITKNVGALAEKLIRLHMNTTYRSFKNKTKKVLNDFNFELNKEKNQELSAVSATKKALKFAIQRGLPFNDYPVTYFGPIDGHDISLIIEILEKIKHESGNIILHVVTQKGRGWLESEKNPSKYHGYSPNKNPSPIFSNNIGEKMNSLMEKDDKVFVITAAMLNGTGLDKIDAKFKDRIIDVGIAEEYAVSLSSGMGLGGIKPYVFIYSTFIQRAIDQIIHDITISNSPVKICLDRAGIVPGDGETHQGIYDISLLGNIPNITIIEPINFEEQNIMVDFMNDFNKPIVMRYSKFNNKNGNLPVEPIKYGKWAYIENNNSNLTIITHGAIMINQIMKLKDLLKEANISFNIVNARFIKPIDTDMIKSLVGNKVVVIEDSLENGSLGSLIATYILNEGLNINLKIIGIKNQNILEGSIDDILLSEGLDLVSLMNKIRDFIHK